MANPLNPPEKGNPPKKLKRTRQHSGKGSAEARLKRDMAIARQTTDRANP
jgi:hypothetical protein